LKVLDALLSEELRRASSVERVRARVLAGAACFLVLFALAGLVLFPPSFTLPLLLGGLVGNLAALGLLRVGRSSRAPALVLCLSLAVNTTVCIVLADAQPYVGTHAVSMLIPALSVFLMGPRLGLVVTALLTVSLGGLHPLYQVHRGIPFATDGLYWPLHLCAAIALVGAWAISSLHSGARDEVQGSLEQALRVLRDNERKLSSLIESTEDVVCSLDTEGRILAANAAARRLYQAQAGQALREAEDSIFTLMPPESRETWRQHIARVLTGQRVRFEEAHGQGDALLVVDVSLNPIAGEDGRVVGLTLFSRNVTARKQAELRLGEMHRTLVDVSRQAGMAEIATGVLHNVGNTLNSVNISTSLLAEQLRKSRVSGLARVASLLREHSEDLGAFLTSDAQGRKLPAYLLALSDELTQEREAVLREVRTLSENVEHLKSIVSMQQKHARGAGTLEQVPVPQLIDEALRLHAVSFERQGIRIEREYEDVPSIEVDRHKLLQILVNLLSNARHALMESPRMDKRLLIRVRRARGERLAIDVVDNGVGIAPETLPRLFTQGFTTKKTGHGFGLHISALAAQEMKGRLSCESAGPGQGATFTLELPLRGEPASA
jgi:PAS domain S-box-containing protein